MKRVVLWIAFLIAPALAAQPLKVVKVGAPKINCLFNVTCKVTVTDLSAPIWSSGFLQSRHYRGSSGAPAATRYAYEYRIDLRNVVGITVIPYITSLTVNIGPTMKFDFDGDGSLDDVFVVTTGGLGNVGLLSAVRSGNNITFTFKTPVAGGSSPGHGDSSFFFGVVSKYAKHNVTASAPNNLGAALSLNAWAPNHP
ncbi:MAG TPA: hypothetical protein VLV78_11265 [Thermoanaerobaculia bacterium]|nr:hypothetical protein [Thermoanaerobaculia bacterium]